MSFNLDGKSALITGGSQGLGLAIAREYLLAGARVMICGRDQEVLKEAASQLRGVVSDSSRLLWQQADVSRKDDVDALVSRSIEVCGRLDVLVNNAGVYGPLGDIEDIDWEEWVRAVQINLMGSVLLCRAVVPHFKKNGGGKIIQLSGGGATSPLPRISAYAASKAAIVRFAETLAEEVREFGIDVNSIAPGALNTRLLDEILDAGPEKVGESFYSKSLKQKDNGGVGLAPGAKLSVFLGSSASDGITGKLISAIWDPYNEFADHLEDLNSTDIYTLRRIVPKDRNLSWGLD